MAEYRRRSANAIFIAGVSRWSSMRSGRATPSNRLVSLEAGQKYYIEVVHKQGDGKDNLAVGWRIPGQDIEVIDGAYLSPWR
ncbi:MAG: hypothetical protein R2856_30720 [Caldilineaceae bacterium]